MAVAAGAAARPPLLPPPVWAHCQAKAEEAQEQQDLCQGRAWLWAADEKFKEEAAFEVWRLAEQQWLRLECIWAAAMASYSCVRAAGSQHAITEPVRLAAEWACSAPDGASVALQLDRAVHWTGLAWGAEPEAWRRLEYLHHVDLLRRRPHLS